jgi:hypothetical protein
MWLWMIATAMRPTLYDECLDKLRCALTKIKHCTSFSSSPSSPPTVTEEEEVTPNPMTANEQAPVFGEKSGAGGKSAHLRKLLVRMHQKGRCCLQASTSSLSQ